MTCYEHAVRVDQDRIDEAKFFNAVSNLCYLSVRMIACIVRISQQLRDRPLLDSERGMPRGLRMSVAGAFCAFDLGRLTSSHENLSTRVSHDDGYMATVSAASPSDGRRRTCRSGAGRSRRP